METKQPPNVDKSESRRSERPLLRIPLQVEGSDAEGKPFRERTSTILVNRTGARISLKNSVRRGDQITITNLLMQESASFRVVERAEVSIGQDPEWGVECVEPNRDILGSYFPGEKRRPSH